MFDIEGFVGRNFDDYRISGANIQVDCPFCEKRIGRDDAKKHLGIGLERQVVHCFRCEYKASWIQFVMDLLGVPYARALGELYVMPTMKDYSSRMAAALGTPIIKEGGAHVGLPGGFHLLDRKVATHEMSRAIRYMERDRGFDLDTCRHYRLGISSDLPARIIIPVEDDYWQGRRILKWMEPKYINPKAKSKRFIFNSQALEQYDEIVVAEGAFSAMAVGYNAIALISKEPTEERLERILASQASRFIIALEPGAYSSMSVLMERLYRAGKDVVVWKYSVGDPADPSGQFQALNYTLRNKVTMIMEGWANGRRYSARAS